MHMETPLHLFYSRRARQPKKYANERYKSHQQKCEIILVDPFISYESEGRILKEGAETGNTTK